jgi:peptide/nickel transport system substrate-binding protein
MNLNGRGVSFQRPLSRRRFLGVGGAALTSVALAPLLAACGGDSTSTSISSNGTAASGGSQASPAVTGNDTPRKGGTIVVGSIQEPDSLNPWLSGLVVAYEVQNMIYDPLTRVDPNGNHVPALAKEVPSLDNGGISADLTTYTYTLRDDVLWHDGTPFTADDVVFTYQAIADPSVNAISRLGFDLIESVSAVDAHTVEFKLNGPSGTFLETWGYRAILPKHKFEGQDMNTTELNRAPTVGTGPYKFVRWATGDRIVVERNDSYYREGAYLDGITYLIVPNSDTLLTMLQTEEIDMRFVLSAEHVAIAKGYTDYDVLSTPAHSYFHITINLNDPVLSDKRVRQALTYGINKTEITETVLKDLVKPHWSPVAEPSWAFWDPTEKMAFNTDKAKQLLDQAGWVAKGSGVREKDGQKLSLDLMNISGDSERLQVAQLLQATLKDIGVQVNIKPVDAATFVAASSSGDFQWAYGFWSWSVDPSTYNDRWLSTSPSNWTKYSNPDVDRLLLDATETIDRDERKKLYTQFQQTVIDDVSNIYIYDRVFFDTVKHRVQNFVQNPSNATNMWNVHEWWVRS